MNIPIDITNLTGDALLAALLSTSPVTVNNKKGRKPSGSVINGSSRKTGSRNTTGEKSLLEIEDERTRIKRIIAGLPDREWVPIGISLMVNVITCLGCGSHHEAPHCEVPMLKVMKRRKDASKATKYIRLDHRIPAIYTKLPRRIQRQQRFTYACQNCFEESA